MLRRLLCAALVASVPALAGMLALLLPARGKPRTPRRMLALRRSFVALVAPLVAPLVALPALAVPGNLLTDDGAFPTARFLPPGEAEVGLGPLLTGTEHQLAILPWIEGGLSLGPVGELALLPVDDGPQLLFRHALDLSPDHSSGWEAGIAYRPEGPGMFGLSGAGGPIDLAYGQGAPGAVADYLARWDLGFFQVDITPGAAYYPTLALPHLSLGMALEQHWRDRFWAGGSVYMDERLSDQNVDTTFSLGGRALLTPALAAQLSWQEMLYGDSATFDGTVLAGLVYRFTLPGATGATSSIPAGAPLPALPGTGS